MKKQESFNFRLSVGDRQQLEIASYLANMTISDFVRISAVECAKVFIKNAQEAQEDVNG